MVADRCLGKRALGPLPKYWHFASTTCRRCLQLAGGVYLWCTVSTDPRPPFRCVRVNDGTGPFWGEEGLRPRSQILALRVYNMPMVLTIAGRVYLWYTVCTEPRPPSSCVRVKDGSGPLFGEEGLGPPSQILALPVYNMPTVSIISGRCLLVVHCVYRPQTAVPLCAGKRWKWAVLGGRGPSAPFPNIGTSRLQHADGVCN